MTNRRAIGVVLFLACTCFAGRVLGAPPLTTTPVGLEARVFYRSQDAGLLTAPIDDKADLTLRIASRAADSASNAWTIYDLRAIAAAPGDYDLRKFLRHADNSAITDGEPIVIRAASSLPASANNDLFPIATGAQKRLGGYRLGLIILGALWLTPIAWLIVKRFRRGKPVAVAAHAGPPTLADQLRPLVESAMSGSLNDSSRARLERLLIAHWRERLHLAARSHADTINILRLHTDAGPLLAHVETWLHNPASSAAPQPDLHQLLAPYRHAAPIAEGAAASVAPSRERLPQEVPA